MPESDYGLLTQSFMIGSGRRGGIADGAVAFGRGGARNAKSDLADVEVLFEAVELEKVGEFERADVTATGTDFLLEIAHDAPELLRSEAGAQELEPEPLPIIAKGELLAGELTVEAMDVLYSTRDFVVLHAFLLEGDGGQPGQPIESVLDMGGADGSAGRASGLFEGALGEMIDGTRQPVGGLDEQFERVVLKRVCAYASGAKSCGDVVARLGGIKRAQAKAEAEPREKPAVDAHLQTGKQRVIAD